MRELDNLSAAQRRCILLVAVPIAIVLAIFSVVYHGIVDIVSGLRRQLSVEVAAIKREW